MSDQTSSVLMWIDLEMTGLDVQLDVIVEIAAIATDTELNVLDEGIDLVVHQSDDVLATMVDIVKSMHEKSGLTAEIRSSPLGLEEAGARTLDYIKGHIPKARTVPLCGNSIGTDRRFLDRYLPEIENHLHYRSIDVSTFKELCKLWYPEAYAAIPNKRQGHRALADIRESIEELRYYRRAMLR